MASHNLKIYKNNGEITEYASSGIVYGSVAYDLNALPKRKQEEQVREKEQIKTKTYESTKSPKQGISLFSIAGFGVFVALMVLVLLANVQLTQITAETASLENRIQALSDEEERLTVKYESTFNLNEIEEYATKKLGMIHQSADNITLLETADADRAVIIPHDVANDTGFFMGLKNFLNSLLEYL